MLVIAETSEKRVPAKNHVLLVGMRLGVPRGFGTRGVVAVHVGAQRVGHDAGVEHEARHLEAEMRAVADVGLEPARERLLTTGCTLPCADRRSRRDGG